MFDRDSCSVVRSLIGLFAFRSNPVSKVYQHRSRNDGILEVTWSTGSLRERTVRDTAVGELTPRIHFCNLLMEQARIEHAPNGSLLTYITSADALANHCIVTAVNEWNIWIRSICTSSIYQQHHCIVTAVNEWNIRIGSICTASIYQQHHCIVTAVNEWNIVTAVNE